MKITEIMTSPVHSIAPEANLRELDQILAARSISGLPVVSEDGEVVDTENMDWKRIKSLIWW